MRTGLGDKALWYSHKEWEEYEQRLSRVSRAEKKSIQRGIIKDGKLLAQLRKN